MTDATAKPRVLTTRRVEYVLHVEGETWEGRQATMEYHYSAALEGTFLTHGRARRIACDFASFTSWYTEEIRTVVRLRRLQSFGLEGKE